MQTNLAARATLSEVEINQLITKVNQMRIIRLKCAICSFWYRPVAPLATSCPTCGAMPIQVSKSRYRYFRLLESGRSIEVVSAVPRYNFTNHNAVAIAQVMRDDNHNSTTGSK